MSSPIIITYIIKGIDRIYRSFKGVRLTVWIIGFLILVYLLGLLIPQVWMFSSIDEYDQWRSRSAINYFLDFTGLTDIYTSPITIGLLALFFLNLLIVTINRVPIVLKKAYISSVPVETNVSHIKRSDSVRSVLVSDSIDNAKTRAGSYFKKDGWISLFDGNEGMLFVKNRYSPFGFLLFHLSFFLCLVGGLLLFYTGFSGNLALTEGQYFDGDIKQFRVINKDPKVMKMIPRVGLLLNKVQASYEKDVPVDLEAVMKVRYKGIETEEKLKVNHPIWRGPVSIIVNNVGVSPMFEVYGPSGRLLDAAYVALNVLKGRQDSFVFDTDKRFKFFVRFFPDYFVENGQEGSRSIELKDPAVKLSVYKESKPAYEGTLEMNDCANIEPFTICFKDVRYWTDMLITREYGRMWLITGFIMASIGLFMRLVFYQKRIRIGFEAQSGKTLVYIDGKSEYFRYSFFKELDGIANKLELDLKKDDISG